MGAAVQQIADWLGKLGMSEYAQRFAENGINVAALPHLTDQDLKDVGVLLGYRRVMLAAISKLAGAATATPEPSVRAESESQDSAERRQVTVMFSDLVGSTALSARMDPEDLHEVISAYQKCVAEIVRRFGGVAKYMGDGGRELAHKRVESIIAASKSIADFAAENGARIYGSRIRRVL